MHMIKIKPFFECYKSIVSIKLGSAYIIVRGNNMYTHGLYRLKKGDIIIKLEFNNKIERATYIVSYVSNHYATLKSYTNETIDEIIDKLIYEEINGNI